jgi:hypothetical protein
MGDLTPVRSSNIEAVGHDGRDLTVRFKGGSTYRYVGVPRSTHAALMRAESKGSFLARTIVPNHKAEKIG